MTQSIEALLDFLPEALRERTRVLGRHVPSTAGEFVLYWMRTAMRVDENPALNVAIESANRLALPVLVYQALSERHPYASDRHHTFVMEGVRDIQAAIDRRNCAFVFHLERPEHRGPHLKTLAQRASLVITEEMPVEPLRSWTERLSRNLIIPVVAVDTACVVPMRLLGKAFERAFAFRKATQALYQARLTRVVGGARAQRGAEIPDGLPFVPLDLRTADIQRLVSQCDIDHSIGPVPDSVGGSIAGYERWEDFKTNGLGDYASRRNDALADGVSRMSAYLHYGMVSPQRIARETAEAASEGADKFLDELLVWRELAYTFCFHRRDHDRTTALPDWAIETLAAHRTDQRPALFSWETLSRGRTGDVLWDAAQRSLLMQGELHNNVRMTWGKAILNWTPDADSALALMIDLNHRYALDGRDPASYGGILWCLGQFDRPFPPPRPILGTVRDRATEQHAQRLEPQAYLRHATRPLRNPMPRVAVIGAGISGLACARTLSDHGFPVTVLEKSRGVGGRMATRRTAEGPRFDHGAQYFTARENIFHRYVTSWMHDGLVTPWRGRVVVLEHGNIQDKPSDSERFVAVPGMNALCKHLATGLDVRLKTLVAPLRRLHDQWQVVSHDGTALGDFDAVIVSAPAQQTAALLAAVPEIALVAGRQEMQGCWAVMLAFTTSLGLDFDGAFVHGSPLSWIARNSSKPLRETQPETWVLHASADWTRARSEDPSESVEPELREAFWQAVGVPEMPSCYRSAHRWRFALPPEPLADRCLFDSDLRVGACGDWCAGPRVEGAFLSGIAAAGRVMGLLKLGEPPKVKKARKASE